jgi:hypothetical protein
MHLCEIEALAVGQDGSGPSPVAEGQLPGAASNSQSRPGAAACGLGATADQLLIVDDLALGVLGLMRRTARELRSAPLFLNWMSIPHAPVRQDQEGESS